MKTRNVCRLCSMCGDDYLDIFSEIGINMKLRDIIAEHFKCEVNDADSLPNFVCQSCWATTESFHELYQKSKDSQEKILERIKSEYDLSEEFPERPDYELHEPHFISTIKDEPIAEEDSILENDPTDDVPNKVSQDEESERSNDDSDSNPDAEHIKRIGMIPFVDRWKLADQKESDFVRLFAENRHRFDMSCDHCPKSFETLNEARHHYANDHNNSKGYIKCCNVKLVYRCKIIEHLYRHLEPEKFKCDECGKVYAARHHLKVHVIKAHSTKAEKQKTVVECNICKKAFSSNVYLQKHILCHSAKSEEEQYRKFIADYFDMNCDECDFVFETFYDAKRHYRELHNQNKGYIKCCDMKLNELWLVVDHINSHLNPRVYSCELCGKSFGDRKKFYLHQRRHKQTMTRPFICDYCGKSFGNKSNIKHHLFNNHVQSEPNFECETCHKRFHLASLLRNHYYSVHREKKVHATCEICGKSFNFKATFDRHLLSHGDKSERLMQRQQCEHCGEWLMSRSGIYYHEKIHNGEISKCDECNREFPHKLSLMSHIRKYHRERQFKCNYCGKTFAISSKLIKHEEGHTRNKIYPCRYCPRKFNIFASLKTHIRRNHRDEQKEFWTNSRLLPTSSN